MRTVSVLGLCLVASLALPAGASAEEQPCPKPIGAPRTPVAAVKPPVTLSASGPAEPMDMGGLRGIGTTDIVVAASPALPASVTPEQITLEIPKRFARTEKGLAPAYLPNPTFSAPQILAHGTLVTFTLCIDASKINPGSYVGQVIVGGPAGIQPATVAVTLNAKNESDFLLGVVLAGIVAFLLLVLRGIKINREKLTTEETEAKASLNEARAKEELARTDAAKATEHGEAAIEARENAVADKEQKRAEDAEKRIGQSNPAAKALLATAADPLGFWAPTIVAVGAAIVAMFQVYDANASWGADATAALIALGGTAIAAAGLGTFLSSLRGS
jgi:ABC-type multidrug transport system fused ATPase/permease subunit